MNSFAIWHLYTKWKRSQFPFSFAFSILRSRIFCTSLHTEVRILYVYIVSSELANNISTSESALSDRTLSLCQFKLRTFAELPSTRSISRQLETEQQSTKDFQDDGITILRHWSVSPIASLSRSSAVQWMTH